jgi:hypothetical protein
MSVDVLERGDVPQQGTVAQRETKVYRTSKRKSTEVFQGVTCETT